MVPTVGRIVHYKLTANDIASISRARADSGGARIGNPMSVGDVYPAFVVRTWGGEYAAVQLQVFLDGNDTLWATSRVEGEELGQWAWPPRV